MGRGILAIVMLAVFVAIVAGVFVMHGRETPSASPLASATASPSPTPSGTPGWKSASDDRADFTFQYPPDMVPLDTLATFPGPPGQDVRGVSVGFPATYAANSTLEDASVSVSAENGGTAACAPYVPNGGSVTPVTVGGITYNRYPTSDVGAGNMYSYRVYATAVGDTCYKLYLMAHSTNVPPKGELPAYDIAPLASVTDQILGTLRLAGTTASPTP